MTTLIDIEKLRVGAELRQKRRDARNAAKALRRAEAAERRRQARAERNAKQVAARARRAYRRATLVAALRAVVVAARPVTPIAAVTAFAMFGQVGYAFDHLTSPSWPWVARVVIAVGFAVTVESIANTVAWYAHTALLAGDTVTAARRRVASYALALLAAAVNYAHFAGPGMSPTPGAVVFALFSALQPWLWGMHTRRTHHLQLKDEGRVDDTGAVFSSARWRAFPVRTWLARRYSIAHGITDPRQAWEGSEAERLARRAARADRRDARRAERAANALRRTELARKARTARAASRRTEPVQTSRTGRGTDWRALASRVFRLGRTADVRPEVARTVPTVRPDGVQRPRTEEPRTEPLPRTEPVRASRPAPAPHPEQDVPAERNADRPEPTRPRRLVAVDPDREADFLAWVATELRGQKPTAYKVRTRYGCRQSVADRLLALLDAPEEPARDREEVSVG